MLISLSVSKDRTFRYQRVTRKWEDLWQLTRADGWSYCVHAFKDGHRHGKNIVQGSAHLVILDFDQHVSIAQAQKIFGGFKYLLCTTKSHQRPKKGVIQDKFRILLPTAPIDLNVDDFRILMRFLANRFGSDPQATNAAMPFACNPHAYCIYGDGKIFDWEPFFAKAKLEDDQQKETIAAARKRHEKRFQKGSFDLARINETFKPHEISKGNRNAELARIALWIRDSGVGYDDASVILSAVNNRTSNPLSDRELQQIMRGKFKG